MMLNENCIGRMQNLCILGVMSSRIAVFNGAKGALWSVSTVNFDITFFRWNVYYPKALYVFPTKTFCIFSWLCINRFYLILSNISQASGPKTTRKTDTCYTWIFVLSLLSVVSFSNCLLKRFQFCDKFPSRTFFWCWNACRKHSPLARSVTSIPSFQDFSSFWLLLLSNFLRINLLLDC